MMKSTRKPGLRGVFVIVRRDYYESHMDDFKNIMDHPIFFSMDDLGI